jgi:hypothetical protein
VIGEWDVFFRLVDPQGTLLLNQLSGTDLYLLNPQKCNANLAVRLTADPIPQASGQISHRRWRAGYTMHLAIQLWQEVAGEREPACDEDVRRMLDTLGLHLNAFENPPTGARVYWQPSGYGDERMLVLAQLASGPTVALEQGVTEIEFDLDSPAPYYLDSTELQTTITDGNTDVVPNDGNADYHPVIQVSGTGTGPATDFTITNHDAFDDDGNELQFIYDSTLPGASAVPGGEYVELNFFNDTAYLNGDEDNMKAGIDILNSDFFPLVPGDNNLEIVGADMLIKSNNAWS